MRTWAILLGGLLVWAGHFFALYGIGEFAGSSAGASYSFSMRFHSLFAR